MMDSELREPRFESPLPSFRSLGIVILSTTPQSLSCMNEYLAKDSGGNVSEQSSRVNCSVARMLPREAELVSE